MRKIISLTQFNIFLLLLFLGVLVAKTGQPSPSTSWEKLERDLQTGPEYRRILAVQAVTRQGGSQAIDLLIRTMLRDKSKPVRRAAQNALQDVADPRIYPAILTALQDPNRSIRLAALDALILVRDPAAANYFTEAAQTHAEDTEFVRLALESLREFVYRVEPPEHFELLMHPWLQHSQRKIQLTTIAILGLMGRPASLSPLLASWNSGDARKQILLADAFANIGRREPVPLLLEALKARDKHVLMHALYALAQIQSFSALEPIRQLLHNQHDTRVRMACLYALIEIPDPQSIPVILELFTTNDATVLHWAAYALGQLHAQSAVPALEEKLNHPSNLVRASAATALAELDSTASEGKLLALVQDPKETSDVCIAAIKALVKLGSQQSAAIIWQQLKRQDLDREMRLNLGLSLGALASADYQPELKAQLSSSDFMVQLVAALALGTMGAESAKPILLPALDHGYPIIRRYAILGLERIMDQDVMRALADTANDDPEPLVRILCASSLVAAGHKDYRVVLWNALDNKAEDIRSEAIIGLGRQMDAETQQQLKWYLRREPSIPVRQTIQQVLREAGKKAQ